MILATDATAAPVPPHLDGLETRHDLYDPDDPVKLPVSWTRYGGDSATSVQYRVNGVPMRFRALEEDEGHSGSETLPIDKATEYELTVALCDLDGCAESDPVAITVNDANGNQIAGVGHMAPRSNEEIRLELERIRASTEALAARYGTPGHHSPRH